MKNGQKSNVMRELCVTLLSSHLHLLRVFFANAISSTHGVHVYDKSNDNFDIFCTTFLPLNIEH